MAEINFRRIISIARNPILLALVLGLAASQIAISLFSQKAESVDRARMQAALVTLQANLSVETTRSKGMGVAAMMGLYEPLFKEAALGKRKQDAPEVLQRLSIPRRHYGYEGTYVIDRTGVMVANDTDGKKATGKSVDFRPYFQHAIHGQESVYVAVGTNSDSRGIYYAAPLYEGADKSGRIIGVTSIKTSAEPLDNVLQASGDDGLLISPQGVVFASTRPEWLLAMTPPFDEKRVDAIRKLKQFGMRFESKNPAILPFDPYPNRVSIGSAQYASEHIPLEWNDPQGPWKLVRLHDAGILDAT